MGLQGHIDMRSMLCPHGRCALDGTPVLPPTVLHSSTWALVTECPRLPSELFELLLVHIHQVLNAKVRGGSRSDLRPEISTVEDPSKPQISQSHARPVSTPSASCSSGPQN